MAVPPHRVVVLALDGVIPFELGIPARIFGGAEGPDGEPLYEVITCTLDGRPVRGDAGFAIAVEHDASALAAADTFVITPSEKLGAMREGGPLPPELAAAFARLRPSTRIASICTASYVLAAAGLLDDHPATTHWREAAHFQRTFPRVRVDRDVLFVDTGTILTSAGAAAGVDLCLHLVRRDYGSQVANQVARRCVVPPWRDGGQAQYVERPVPEPESSGTAATRVWAMEHLGRPITLTELAAHARMSVRSFTRHFHAEVGTTPGQWLTAQRVELARQLLESSVLSVDQVADRAGFGTSNSLRQHMRATLGISPSAYRRTFNSRAPARG
ncbi:GlxA family transcriptional regulator [Streptomyces sp. NBC_01803]|uniref:GlxA family transcriptional regulator n=1 Tax=Streptomyces sp. NBC_01803 TaxID=2975946 RepID=UPI002DDBBF66|nr:helix-turn-helix domain-containing protein [Streptomyces sp. NBC_01803]WSA45353.1 helix-turn-helix domain-containing protein [Streptomyces sp. NBC_01803]